MGDIANDVPVPPVDPLNDPGFEQRFNLLSNICFALREQIMNDPGSLFLGGSGETIDPLMVHATAMSLCAIITLYNVKDQQASARSIYLSVCQQMHDLCRCIQNLDFHQLDFTLGVSLPCGSYNMDSINLVTSALYLESDRMDEHGPCPY
jgi:hypothetical protein